MFSILSNLCNNAKYEVLQQYNASLNLADILVHSESDEVCAIYSSQIVYVHKHEDNTWCVAALIDSYRGYLIKNLSSVSSDLDIGAHVGPLYCLGKYNSRRKNNYIAFSYFNSQPSHWPIRIFDMQFYKQDPKVLEDSIENLQQIDASLYTDNYDNLSIESPVPHEDYSDGSDYAPGEPIPKLSGDGR